MTYHIYSSSICQQLARPKNAFALKKKIDSKKVAMGPWYSVTFHLGCLFYSTILMIIVMRFDQIVVISGGIQIL
jgi:hypothetical protein